MPYFSKECNCLRHDEWHHSNVNPSNLRNATHIEHRYCVSLDRGHEKTRKRKICLACRGRIEVEKKPRKLSDKTTVRSEVRSKVYIHSHFRVANQRKKSAI